MAKGPVNGDRIRRTDTGVRATYVDTRVSKGRGVHLVILDTGPKHATDWEHTTPLEVLPKPKACPRCQGDHHAFYCPVLDTPLPSAPH